MELIVCLEYGVYPCDLKALVPPEVASEIQVEIDVNDASLTQFQLSFQPFTLEYDSTQELLLC